MRVIPAMAMALTLLLSAFGLAQQPGELRVFKGHSKGVRGVAISPDGKQILSGSEDDTARIWDASTGKEVHSLNGHTSWVSSVAFSPDGKQALTGGYDNVLILWDAATGKRSKRFLGHDKTIWSVAFSPDGKRIASGSGNIAVGSSPADNTVRIWDVAGGQELKKLTGHREYLKGVAWSPDGKMVVSGGRDGIVRTWDVDKGKEVLPINVAAWVLAVAWSPDGSYLASGDLDHHVRLWDAKTGKEVRKLDGHEGAVNAVAFSPDGSRLLTGGGGFVREGDKLKLVGFAIRLWDVKTGKELHRFEGHTRPVTSLAFARDGKTFVSGSEDTTVRLWQLPK